MDQMIWEIISRCQACHQANASSGLMPLPGIREQGLGAGRVREVDFAEVRPGQYGYRYLPIFVDTFFLDG